jgi:3-methyl-2-oxobutanoate hydroxymethyltransferase
MADAPKPVTTLGVVAMKAKGERIVMLTCYDALFARLLDASGVDILLVGDSVNEVLAGQPSTLSATLDQMIYHTSMVRRGTQHALVVCDMPFLTYQVSTEEAIRNSGRVMAKTGCHAVKLEGGRPVAATVRALVDVGIPVMGHLGLTPQSVHALGGFRVQGKDLEAARAIVDDAIALADAGCFAVVLECVPDAVARLVTDSIAVPTIGIGAGRHCDGQVLVMHDLLGLEERITPKFVRRYAELGADAVAAVSQFADDVRAGRFPSSEETYHAADTVSESLNLYSAPSGDEDAPTERTPA